MRFVFRGAMHKERFEKKSFIWRLFAQPQNTGQDRTSSSDAILASYQFDCNFMSSTDLENVIAYLVNFQFVSFA
jgi:hypothetical protein